MERLILAVLADAWPEAMTSTRIADALLRRGDPYPLTSVKARLVRMTHTGVVERGPGNRGYRHTDLTDSQDLRWAKLLVELNATKPYTVVYFDTCGRKWAHECVARNPSEAEDDCWDNVQHVSSIAEVIER